MIEYTIDKVGCILRVRMSGANSAADLARHYSRVLDDPDYNPALDILFIITPDAGGDILAELPEAGEQMEALAHLQHGTKWAVVMAAGFRRTIVEYLLAGVRLGSVKMRFFDDEARALAWLGHGHNAQAA